MFSIVLSLIGVFIGLFFGISIAADQKISGMEKWWGSLAASIITAINFGMLISNLKEYFK